VLFLPEEMKSSSSNSLRQAAISRQPKPSPIPHLPGVRLAALYRKARVGGDFFEFAVFGERLILLLLDIAGERAGALEVAAVVQESFRQRLPELFGAANVNEAEGLIELAHDLNRSLMGAAGGVRCTPGFLACYSDPLGTLWYLNAGHTPGLIRDKSGVQRLEASGLPLGLFSHATHDAQIYVLPPGGALALVSRGLVEARAGKREFGIEGVERALEAGSPESAQELCAGVLESVRKFEESSPAGLFRDGRFRLPPGLLGFGQRQPANPSSEEPEEEAIGENDLTVIALVRNAAAPKRETDGTAVGAG
jgi:sigma-B regulation protein RsbU (phosphoserine phosphatase)